MKAFSSFLTSKKKQNHNDRLEPPVHFPPEALSLSLTQESHSRYPSLGGTRLETISTVSKGATNPKHSHTKQGSLPAPELRYDVQTSILVPAASLSRVPPHPKGSQKLSKSSIALKLRKSFESPRQPALITIDERDMAPLPRLVPPVPRPSQPFVPERKEHLSTNRHAQLTSSNNNNPSGSAGSKTVPTGDLYQRRRARSVGAQAINSHPDNTIAPSMPVIAPLRLNKEAPVPTQLPTPNTPSLLASVKSPTMIAHSGVPSGGSAGPASALKSVPRIDGVWNDFLKEIEEDIDSLIVDGFDPVSPRKDASLGLRQRPPPLPISKPRSKTLGSSTVIEMGLPSPGPPTPRPDAPLMLLSAAPLIQRETENSSHVPDTVVASHNATSPEPSLDPNFSTSSSHLPYLSSVSSVTISSEFSLSLFPSPPSVPIMRPTDSRGIFRTQGPHPSPECSTPSAPVPLSNHKSPRYAVLLQSETMKRLSPDDVPPIVPDFPINQPSDGLEDSLKRTTSQDDDGGILHSPLSSSRSLHAPSSSISSYTRSTGHSYRSSSGSSTSISTNYSSLLRSLENARVSVGSSAAIHDIQEEEFIGSSANTESRAIFVNRSLQMRDNAAQDSKSLNPTIGLSSTVISRSEPTAPLPPMNTEVTESQAEPMTRPLSYSSRTGSGTVEWGYAL